MNEVRVIKAIVDDVRRHLASLEAVLEDADDLQWMPGRRRHNDPRPTRKRGEVADPTASTVMDPARLRLRAAVREALRLVYEADGRVRGARNELVAALEAHGGRSDSRYR